MVDAAAIDVAFDRDTPKTGVVTVTTAAGTLRITLPVLTGSWCTAGAIPPAASIRPVSAKDRRIKTGGSIQRRGA